MISNLSFSPSKQQSDDAASSVTRYQVDSLVIVTKLNGVGREATKVEFIYRRCTSMSLSRPRPRFQIMCAAKLQTVQTHHCF